MQILQRKFEEVYNSPCWVPDWNEHAQKKCPPEINHVLLMGSYYERIFQPEYWPEHPFKLYVLSNPIKNILIKQFGFSFDTVEVVDRYKFFPISNIETVKLDLVNFNLVHIGRTSPQKNIEFIIFLNFHLQFFHNKNISLYLIGPTDNEYHHQNIEFYSSNYQNKLQKIINSLPWIGQPPTFITNYNSTEWKTNLPQKSLFFSASNLISEDFSVSVAEVQQLGIPAMIPNWGGFTDVFGDNIYKYNSNLIADSNTEIPLISQKARQLAIDFPQYIKVQNNTKTNTICDLKEISKNYLESIFLLNLKKYSSDLNLVRNHQFGNFMKVDAGKKFIDELKLYLGGTI